MQRISEGLGFWVCGFGKGLLSPLKGLRIRSSRFAFCILGTGPVVASSDTYIYIHMYKHIYGTLKGGYRDDE